MLHQHHGDAHPADLSDQVRQAEGFLAVEAGGRFVHQDDAGLGGQGSRDL